MSWGPCFFYYHCPSCGRKFKYATDLIPDFGARFGLCPRCGVEGVLEKEGARTPDDLEYEEIEEN